MRQAVSNYIRRGIAIAFVSIYLLIAMLTASYPIYLEVFKSMSIPMSVVLSFYFGNSIVSKLKNNGENKELDD